jgi:Tol biopolymer transport system component/imidazolonepropionase-like amidohydrolase
VTLREGTSMAAALSPDGRTIALDLVGALWTVGISGGAATRILEDGYDARMPAWSPDGRQLAFQAYRSGTWAIWTMNADGRNVRQVTSGPFDDREPHWSPDGTRLAFSSDRSGNYDVWTVAIDGGVLRQLTTDAGNDFMPAWSPDGREIAFVSDRRERGVYAIDAASAREHVIQLEAATVAAPSFAPGGASVTYAAYAGSTSRLMVGGNNIADLAEDVFPFRAQWLSALEILYTADGKIKRRPATGGPARTIEFSADVSFARSTFTLRPRALTTRTGERVRGVMHPAISPDGQRVAFAALGDLWVASTRRTEAVPERITSDPFVETDPAWSPDGTRLAYSSDRDGSMDLWIRDLPSGSDRKVAAGAMAAAWSPDGLEIAFLDLEAQLQIVDVAGGGVRKAHDRLNEPGRPSWSPDGRAVVMSVLKPYSTRFREGINQVLHVTVRKGAAVADRWLDPVPHKSIGMREDFGPVWSPDGTQMAAIVDGHLAAFPVAPDGTPTGPARRLSPELANTPSWTRDSRTLLYQTADRLRLVDVVDGSTRDVTLRLTWSAKPVSTTSVVHAARLFDGRSAVRENVDVVIAGNRITRVEAHRADLHKGIVVDASSGTVLPGLIESHAHQLKAYGESLGRIWLSFGVTTVRNPAANPFEALEDREATESGARIGPRLFITGEPFDGTRIYYPGGTALDGGTQLAEHVARAEALNFDFIKTYVRLPDLLQKRIIAEAHRLGLPVTSHEIYPAVAYGADGVEHIRGTSRRGYSPKMSELRRSYADVVDMLAASGMTLTPTIGIQGGHQVLTLADGSWVDDIRIRQLFPAAVAAAGRAVRERPPTPQDRTLREALVTPQERMVAAVVKSGGRVIAGTDSPINPYGLSLLGELEHFVRGRLTPMEALRTATSVPAEAMGLGAVLGTIERGKLADLVVVDGNPLADIRDIRRTTRVIKDGVVYDVDALMRAPAKPVPTAQGRPQR